MKLVFNLGLITNVGFHLKSIENVENTNVGSRVMHRLHAMLDLLDLGIRNPNTVDSTFDLFRMKKL